MPRIYLALAAVVILVVAYLGWHRHVWQQGYDKRVSEEQATVTKAQPIIKEGEAKYEETIRKIYAAPEGACGVDPAVAAALDSLR